MSDQFKCERCGMGFHVVDRFNGGEVSRCPETGCGLRMAEHDMIGSPVVRVEVEAKAISA